MTEQELLYHSLRGLHLLERAPGAQVVHDLLGLQAQFSRNPQISLRLRASDYDPAAWDAGLVKVWTHRGTIHVLREDELGLYLSAAGMGGAYRDGAWGMTAREQEEWSAFIAGQVRAGNDTREGLKQAARDAGMGQALLERVFYGWGGLLKEMCWRGELACCTGTDKRYRVPGPVTWMPQEEARLTLARRYFEHFGPATWQDCMAFFGWGTGELRPLKARILSSLDAVVMDGVTYYFAGPLPAAEIIPPCVLVPGFDQLVMGYRRRERFLDAANARKLINVAGIVFPSVILRGRIRARWKLEGDAVQVTPFERLLKKDEAALRREVRARLGRDVTVTFLPQE